MLCRASRRLDVGPTSLDGSTADREVAHSGPTTPQSIRPTQARERQRSRARGAWGTPGESWQELKGRAMPPRGGRRRLRWPQTKIWSRP